MEIQPPVRIFLFFWFDNSHRTHDFCWGMSSEYFLCKCSDFTLHSKAYFKPLVYCYSAKFLWGLQYHQIFPDLSINERAKWIGACYFSYLVVPFSGKKENMSYFLKENYQDIKIHAYSFSSSSSAALQCWLWVPLSHKPVVYCYRPEKMSF